MSSPRRRAYLGAAMWCLWQFGVMLLHLQLRQAGRHAVCVGRCLWWAVRAKAAARLAP